MAGYSGTPLPKKLGINERARLALIGAPPGFDRTLGEMPAGVTTDIAETEVADVIVCFVTDVADLPARFAELKPRLDYAGGLWIGWPKRQKGVASRIGEDDVREVGLAAGLVDNKVCAIDERWSGLRFVYRREDRPRG